MRIAICLFFAAMILAGCTTTEQPDGSTRVSVSLRDKLGLQPRNAARASASTPEAAPAADAARAPAPTSGAGRQSDIPSSAPAYASGEHMLTRSQHAGFSFSRAPSDAAATR